MASDSTSELQQLSEECERLRKDRDHYQGDLKSVLDRNEEFLADKLKLFSQELSKQIQIEFYERIKTSLWIAGLLLAVASLGGFLTIRDMAKHAIDDAIQKRESDFKHLSDTGIEDVVKLRTQTQIALEETRRVTNAAKADAARKSAEITKQTEDARRLILDTTKYWEAAKIAIDRAKGTPPTQKEESESQRTRQIVTCLREAGVHDVDVDEFYAVIKDDVALLQDALARGANPNVTTGDLIRRHADVVSKSCPSLSPRK
ncbi:MAG: hypothetical protein JWM83_2029 [Candidatus Angelobacter sp.]|nr:hypothetical protein [Candidatus Angelobacter sp.]